MPLPYFKVNQEAVQGNQLASMEMKAPSALPVRLQVWIEVVRDRPTQGWTVDEACLLCKVIYIL